MLFPRLTQFRERVAPPTRTLSLFEEFGAPHVVEARQYRHPFMHAVIEDLLPRDAYDAVAGHFSDILARGLSETKSSTQFARFELYDLYSYMPKPSLDSPQKYFFSESYIKGLESLLGVSVSRYTFLTYHHHKPSAEDNFIHTDYGVGYFKDDPLQNGITAWHGQCPHTKASDDRGVRKMVRAIAAIYYLNNKSWNKDDGGETGVFASRSPQSLVRVIAPRNNRLLTLSITPSSFHNFMKNNMQSRNSIAQWFFIPEEEAEVRFPGARPSGWKD